MKVFSLLNCNIRTYLIIYSSFFEDYDDGNDDDGDDDDDGGDDDGGDDDVVNEITLIINKVLLIQNIVIKELIVSLNEVNTTLSLYNGTQGKGHHYKRILFVPFYE